MRTANIRRIIVLLPLAGVVAYGAAQSPPPRPRITGINHVAFRVSDAAAARRFYGSMLGLEEQASSTKQRVSFFVGRQHVILQTGLPAGEDERLLHLAFETPDVDALAAYLTARGVAVTRPPDACEKSAIVVTDPDGHAIEFVQKAWPPGPVGPWNTAISNRVMHAGLIVRDEEAAHTFYRDALGFSEIWRGGRPEGTTNWVNMRVPDGTDYLEYMLYNQPPDRRQRGSAHHICLRVGDIQAAFETAATRAGSTQRLGPPNVGVNGKWQLNLFDPDGTRVELMEPFRTR